MSVSISECQYLNTFPNHVGILVKIEAPLSGRRILIPPRTPPYLFCLKPALNYALKSVTCPDVWTALDS